nr:hypothetical protein [Janthinobacterium lividum]
MRQFAYPLAFDAVPARAARIDYLHRLQAWHEAGQVFQVAPGAVAFVGGTVDDHAPLQRQPLFAGRGQFAQLARRQLCAGDIVDGRHAGHHGCRRRQARARIVPAGHGHAEQRQIHGVASDARPAPCRPAFSAQQGHAASHFAQADGAYPDRRDAAQAAGPRQAARRHQLGQAQSDAEPAKGRDQAMVAMRGIVGNVPLRPFTGLTARARVVKYGLMPMGGCACIIGYLR